MSNFHQDAKSSAPDAAPGLKPKDENPAHRGNHNQTLAREMKRARHNAICLSFPRLVIKKESILHPTSSLDLQMQPRLSEDIYATRRHDDVAKASTQSTNPQSQDFKQILLRVRQFAADVLQVNGIRCEIITPPDLKQIQLSSEQCQHIFWLFQETFNHLADQTHSATSILSITVNYQWLRIKIRHEGCGSVSKLLGQSSVNGRWQVRQHTLQARIIELKGALEIAAAPGFGAALTLTIPLAQLTT